VIEAGIVISSSSAASWEKYSETLNKAASRLNEVRDVVFTQGQAQRQISSSCQVNAGFQEMKEIEVFQTVFEISEVID
jgi:hypothetical protein